MTTPANASRREPSPLLQDEEPFHPTTPGANGATAAHEPDDDFDEDADDEQDPEEYAEGQEGLDAGELVAEGEPEENEDLAHARKLNRLVRGRRELYERSAEETKSKKKLLESAQEQLNEFLDSLDESYPLFDRKPEPSPAPAAAEASAEPATLDAPGRTGWEGTSLRSIEGFPPGPLGKLEEAGITGLGQLAEFTRSHPLTDVKGIGEAKAEAVERALDAFWEAWDAKYPEKADKPA